MAVKPTTPSFDPTHELSDGLVYALLMTEGEGTVLNDLIGDIGNSIGINTTWANDGDDGPVVVLNGSSSLIALPPLSGVFSTEASLYMRLKLNSNTPNQAQSGLLEIDGSTLSDHYPLTAADRIFVSTFRTTREAGPTSDGVNRALWHSFAVSNKPGATGWKVFQNGKALFSATGQSDVSVGETNVIGRSTSDPSSHHYLQGRISTFLMWDRALSDAEMANLDLDPWAMFRGGIARRLFGKGLGTNLVNGGLV